MKLFRKLRWAGLLVLVLAGSAWADRPYHHHPYGGVRLGVYIGDPWFYPPLYPYPPFPPWGPRIYVPAPVIVSPPPVYIEQRPPVAVAPAAPATPEPGYWYYCDAAKGYYPYIKECPGGWQKVAPQPAQ